MSDSKSQAPAALAVTSYVDAIENASFDGGQKRPQSAMASSPFPAGGVQSFPISESLLTPRDPGFLDGASSLARFGLDVGGTLCKVVYFEPAVNFISDPSRRISTQSKAVGLTEGVVAGKNGKDNTKAGEAGERSGCNGDSQRRDGWSTDPSKKSTDKERNGSIGGTDKENSTARVTDGNAKELMTVGVDRLTKSNTSTAGVHYAADVHVDSSDRVEKGKDKNGNGRTTESVAESCRRSDGKPAIQVFERYKVDRNPGGTGGNEDDQDSHKRVKKIWVSSHEPVHLPGRGTLYFKCFETWRMDEFLNLTKEYHLLTGGRAIGATGGGARKFGDQFLEIAGLRLQRADELRSLVRGIDFLARHAQQESFEYPTGSYEGGSIQRPWQSPENSSDDSSDISSEDEFPLTPCGDDLESQVLSPATEAAVHKVAPPEMRHKTQTTVTPTLKGPVVAKLGSGFWTGSNEPLHPYLVVNIGSGVSMLRVDSPEKFERVGGTSLGGSTFLGLANALTGCESFEEAIFLATQGDSTHVDMLVGDIYGGDYTEMGLAATTVASSFGKLVLPGRSTESRSPQNMAKAALLMVTNNIGSIAMLHARNAGVHSIMFTGSFLHNNKLAMRLLAVAMEFWSKGNMKAVFLRHEGHAGAMGALLSAMDSSNPLDALLLT